MDAVHQIWVDIVYVEHAYMTCHLMMSDTSRWSFGLGIIIMNQHLRVRKKQQVCQSTQRAEYTIDIITP